MNTHCKRIITAISTLALVSATAGPAVAATACFRPAEIEADQAMRFQAELMVVSDTCGVDTYRDFTVRNREAIVDYQHELLDRFRRVGVHSPENSLESFLTQIANELAIRDGKQLARSLCDHSIDFLATAQNLNVDQFRHHVAEMAAANRANYRSCP